jgi:hypothetical protein
VVNETKAQEAVAVVVEEDREISSDKAAVVQVVG